MNADQVVVRTAVASDLDAAVELFAQLDALEHDWRVFAIPADAPDRTRSRFARLISAEDATVIVAQAGDRLVGLGAGEVTTPSSYSDEVGVEFRNIYVEPSYRGYGVGPAIVRELAAFAARRGVRRIALNVFSANEEASRFWRGLGFTPRRTQFTAEVDHVLAQLLGR
jgi:ribosomal protein S18 acetylase RimI-like enzyme